ncbi:MAG TPA: DUF4236 domain-containing protein [Acetobacteraceae bacterium]|nr:DUF4236 domain-containing protein [Acetobacteraceae bacterium]
MPFRFFRSLKIGKGLHLNISRSGLGVSQRVGPLTLGSKRTTVNLPGTGASLYVNNSKGSSSRTGANTSAWVWLIGAIIVLGLCICIGVYSALGGTDLNSTATPAARSIPVIFSTETYTSVESLFPTGTLTVFATRIVFPSPSRRATWTPGPATATQPTLTKIVPSGSGAGGAVCSCSADMLNCTSFSSTIKSARLGRLS